MHLADWLIMLLPLAVCACIAVYSRKFCRSVADFMAGGRNAGRFLICTARSEQGAGAVCFVSSFQVFMVAGFAMGWWGTLSVPLGLIIAISGFVIYRYRQTRAMTLGQFFEMRYGRNFRLFAGGLCFFAGLVNFGIIPVIGARFMVYFLQLPPVTDLFGFHIPTHLILMTIFLATCVVMTTSGGQISVLLTDCAEGMISQIFYAIIAVVLVLFFFKWSMARAELTAVETGKSLVNPFDTGNVKDFNIWFVLMSMFNGIYTTMAWQNSHGFNSAAANPHESRMGLILGRWRGFASGVMVTLLTVCAFIYLKSPDGSVAVNAVLSGITDESTRSQMETPIALTQMLPVGIKGMFLSICIMGIIAGDGIHLHSWSSIFVQDVLMPLRKKPLTTEQHIKVLRFAVVGVAIWAWCFGAIFPQTEYVNIWFAVTEAIFTGGAGVAIIGGLYWARGTITGAWAGMITGCVLAVGGITTRIVYKYYVGHEFVLNGKQVAFFGSLIAIAVYVIVSWLTCKKPHNMDRLLHRGEYSVEAQSAEDAAGNTAKKKVSLWYRIMGIDEQFSKGDRFITIAIWAWSMFWFAVFVVGSISYVVLKWYGKQWSDVIWVDYWLVHSIFLPLVIGLITTVWFTWGCSHDMIKFFKALREEKVDAHDDGSVIHGEGEAMVLSGANAACKGPQPLTVQVGSVDPDQTTVK